MYYVLTKYETSHLENLHSILTEVVYNIISTVNIQRYSSAQIHFHKLGNQLDLVRKNISSHCYGGNKKLFSCIFCSSCIVKCRKKNVGLCCFNTRRTRGRWKGNMLTGNHLLRLKIPKLIGKINISGITNIEYVTCFHLFFRQFLFEEEWM